MAGTRSRHTVCGVAANSKRKAGYLLLEHVINYWPGAMRAPRGISQRYIDRLDRVRKGSRPLFSAIVREVLKVTKEVPIERAYDSSFANKADSGLTQTGWKP